MKSREPRTGCGRIGWHNVSQSKNPSIPPRGFDISPQPGERPGVSVCADIVRQPCGVVTIVFALAGDTYSVKRAVNVFQRLFHNDRQEGIARYLWTGDNANGVRDYVCFNRIIGIEDNAGSVSNTSTRRGVGLGFD